MKKKSLIALIAVSAILIVLAVIFLSSRLVVYVYPSEMEDFSSRFFRPSFFNAGYLLVARNDSEVSLLEKIKKCSLYIYTPYSRADDGKRYSSYTMVKDGEMIVPDYSREEMYSSFISLFSDSALVYDDCSSENVSLYSSLNAEYPSLGRITYSERVSVVNEERLTAESDGYYALIITDPLSSESLYRNTSSRVAADEMNAVALVSLDGVISLHYDWDPMIREVLSSDSVTSYYAFSVLH